jgi:hypothetical protein
MSSIQKLPQTMSFSRSLAASLRYGLALEKRILIAASFGSAVQCYYEDESGLDELRRLAQEESFRKNVSQATGIRLDELQFSETRLAPGEILHLYGHVYGLNDEDWLIQEKRAKAKAKEFAEKLSQSGVTTGTVRYESSRKLFSLRTDSGDELLSLGADEATAAVEQHELRSLNADYFDQTDEVFVVLNPEQNLILSLPGKPEDGCDFLLSLEILPRKKESEK